MPRQSATGRKADSGARQPKRQLVDFAALTSEVATPMSEAPQRAALIESTTKTANLQALAFKVSPAFRIRFRQRAATANLKLNELLFEALAAWEEKHGMER